ncbi:MAG: hypothetical protein PHW01_02535 [Patescibacteria group bacterium]|nr:hypothetical protein [Patescibacteria group bacterium]
MENLEQESGNIYTEKIERNNIDIEEIKRFYDMIRTKMENAISPSGELSEEAWDKLTDFIQQLKNKYGQEELQKCAAFHAATGSGIPEGKLVDITRLDFPGGDSIEDFLDSQK